MRVLILFSALFGLAGCLSAPVDIPVSTSPQVGSDIVEARWVGGLFVETCIKTRDNTPAFKGALELWSQQPVVQSPETGTVFHQRLNLSLNVDSMRCSIVFGTDQPVDEVIRGTAAGAVAQLDTGQELPRDIDISSQAADDGLRYFRMVIPARRGGS